MQLALPNGKTRYFNGYVTRFAQGGMHGRYYRYRATLRPWLWFLTRTADCRIFQEMTVPDIIKKVFGDHSDRGLRVRAHRDSTASGTTACSTARPTSTSSAGSWSRRASTTTSRTPTGATRGAGRLATAARPHSRATRTIALHHLRQACDGAGAGPHQRAGTSRGRDPARGLCADRLRLRAPERGLGDQAEGQPQARARGLRDLRLSRRVRAEGRRRHTTPKRAWTSCSSQFELAHGRRNARGMCAGRTVHARRTSRATIRTASTWWWRRRYDLEFSDYEAMPSPSAARATAAASRCYRPSSSSGRSALTPKPVVQGPQTAVVVGPTRRGDLHRQVRPGEGAVPLGPLRQERREQLVLDARLAALGRQELGRRSPSRASARK